MESKSPTHDLSMSLLLGRPFLCVAPIWGLIRGGLRSPFQAAAFPISSIEPEFVVVAASEHVDLFVESPSH